MLLLSICTLLQGLLFIGSFIIHTGNANTISGQLPEVSLISTFFNTFIKPYLKTRHAKPAFRAFEEAAVEKAIRQKIEQLKPFLQDNEVDLKESDNKFTFEGNDETTIIEFLPSTDEKSKSILRNENNTFKASMLKYKRIKTKINKALEKEMVSDKTKTLVMKTLDELISKMIETQCNWKSGVDFNLEGPRNRLVVPRTIVHTWNKEWQKFKTTFSTLVNYRTNDPVKNIDNLMLHLNTLNNIIKDVSDNLEMFSNKYIFNCNIIADFKRIKENKGALRHKEKNICKYFKVCSTELKSFFTELYNSVNDTAVSVLRSYGEMFTRDVNTDVSNEKNAIVSLIFNTGNEIEKQITKIFVKDILQFKLDDQKNKEANIILLSNYVKNFMRDVKQEVIKVLEVTLKQIPRKVYHSIQQDVTINLDVDVGNLERDMVGKICFIFNVCNNHVKSGRRLDSGMDPANRIYVKVELTMDDEFKDALKNNTLLSSLELNSKFFDVSKHVNSNGTNQLWNFKKYTNISVTRTTRV